MAYAQIKISVMENETNNILLAFEIKTGRLIMVRRPDLVIIKQKLRTCCLLDFATSVNLTG